METIKLEYGAAIPVGHHVEVVWSRLIGGRHRPVVTDRETGIVYAADWACDAATGELREVDVLRRLDGRVTRCLVVADTDRDYRDVSTWLTVAPPATPYR